MVNDCNTHKTEKLYTIGEVAKLCKVSKKTLRFYEEIGIISPNHIHPENGYRYYAEDTMMLIPIIKYYKQMGFKLQEMMRIQDKPTSFYHEHNFYKKLTELEEEEKRIQNSRQSLSDWLDLLREGNLVIKNQINTINVKYIEKICFYSLKQPFNYNYKNSIINIPWVNYLENYSCAITGPVYLYYDSYEKKASNQIKEASILQKPVGFISPEINQECFGECFFAAAYHIGRYDTIHKKYEEMIEWCDKNNYLCGAESYERYVIDYWTTQNEDAFVTEILLPISKSCKIY